VGVFEKRVLKRLFGPKRDALIGSLRKSYKEELHNLYSSPDIIRMVKLRRIKWARHIARKEKRGREREKNPRNVLVGKCEGWRQLGSSRRKKKVKLSL
jgi:hypothetical protein